MQEEITIEQAVNTYEGLVEISKRPFPIKLSYRIAKITNKLEKDYLNFMSHRFQLFKKYGDPIKDPKGIETYSVDNVSGERREKFEAERKILLSIEYEKIPLNLFQDKDHQPELLLEPYLFCKIEWLLDETS